MSLRTNNLTTIKEELIMTKATMTKKIKEIIKNAACEEEIIVTVMDMFDDAGVNLLDEIMAKEEKKTVKATNTTNTTTKKPATKKTTKKTTKKAQKNEQIVVTLKAFTGMTIGTYTAQLNKNVIKIVTKNGNELEFNLDGTQKTPSKNPRFNNRIEIANVAEA